MYVKSEIAELILNKEDVTKYIHVVMYDRNVCLRSKQYILTVFDTEILIGVAGDEGVGCEDRLIGGGVAAGVEVVDRRTG